MRRLIGGCLGGLCNRGHGRCRLSCRLERPALRGCFIPKNVSSPRAARRRGLVRCRGAGVRRGPEGPGAGGGAANRRTAMPPVLPACRWRDPRAPPDRRRFVLQHDHLQVREAVTMPRSGRRRRSGSRPVIRGGEVAPDGGPVSRLPGPPPRSRGSRRGRRRRRSPSRRGRSRRSGGRGRSRHWRWRCRR
jgi:hypothetical protein